MFALIDWVREPLALPELDAGKRADFEERVDRAIAELYGERPDERRALIYGIIRACAWDNDPPVPADEQSLFPPLTPAQRVDRRVELVVRSVADVDPLFAETLDRVLVKQALEAFSYNKGGHGGRATLSRESAMRALLARTPAGGAGMKRIRYRAPRRQPR